MYELCVYAPVRSAPALYVLSDSGDYVKQQKHVVGGGVGSVNRSNGGT